MTEQYYTISISFHKGHEVAGQEGVTMVNFTLQQMKEFRFTAWQSGVIVETAPGTRQLVSPFSIKEIFIINQLKKHE